MDGVAERSGRCKRPLHRDARRHPQRRRSGGGIGVRAGALAGRPAAGRSRAAASAAGERAVCAESRRCRHAGGQARVGVPIGWFANFSAACRCVRRSAARPAPGRRFSQGRSPREARRYEHRNHQLHPRIHGHIRRYWRLRDVSEWQQHRRGNERGRHIDGYPPHGDLSLCPARRGADCRLYDAVCFR